MTKSLSQTTMDVLSEKSRIVDFTKPVLQTKIKMDMIKDDAKTDKTAKAYLQQVEEQFRNQLKFLYEAASDAFPEDGVEPSHAHSSLGPAGILEKYEFKVIVTRKEK
jgi:hypothetical protein